MLLKVHNSFTCIIIRVQLFINNGCWTVPIRIWG